MFDSLRPHGLQHARLLCPLPSPGVCSNSYPLSNAIWPSHPLASPPPPALNFPSIRIFSNESALCIEWPKYWSFSFSISPSNEYLGLISFTISSRKQLNWRSWNFQLSYFLHKSRPSWTPHPRSSRSARLGALREVHFFDCSVPCGFKAAPAWVAHRWERDL